MGLERSPAKGGCSSVHTRELMVSRILFPLSDIYRGTSVMKKTRFLQKSQWWDAEKLQSFQLEKLQALVAHAYQNVPYYRRLFSQRGIAPSDIKDLADLAKIPVLTKSDVRQFKEELVAINYRGEELLSGRTGGSTGEPLQFFNDRNTVSWAWGAMNRYYEWTGMRIGEGRFDIGGGSLGGFLSKGLARDTLRSIQRWLQKGAFYPVFSLDKAMAREIAESAKARGIRVFRGYPSGLYVLAKYAEAEGLDFKDVRIIQSTSERVYPHQREVIESNLTADMYDQYGAAEILSIAAQCEKKKAYHVFDEHVIVEDDRTLSSTNGRVPAIITDLDNFAMPFIRYEVGDILNFKGASCTCGRGLSVIGKVEGRTHDFLTATDGRPIAGEFIPHLFQKVRGFDRYFIHQVSRAEIVVSIVANEDYNVSEIDELARLMKEHLGQDMEIRFESVDRIGLSSTGKLQFIKSEVEPVFD